MGTRRVVFQLDQELYERAHEAADADRRSFSNWVALTVERAVESKPCDTVTSEGDRRGLAA